MCSAPISLLKLDDEYQRPEQLIHSRDMTGYYTSLKVIILYILAIFHIYIESIWMSFTDQIKKNSG